MTTIELFETDYQEFHAISEGRRRAQLRALRHLTKFAGVETPEEVSPAQYQDWIRALVQELAPSTVKKQTMCVRPFFKFAFQRRLYSAESLLMIREAELPKAPKRVPRPYSSKEVKTIWAAIDKRYPLDKDERWLKRWRKGSSRFKRIEAHANHLQLRALVRLALDCGLRRQELYDLDLDDMHYDNAFVVVREGKEGKFREVPYTSAAREAVKAWLEFRAEMKPPHDRPWLALTRIGPQGVWLRAMNFRRFEMYIADLGSWNYHRLRHTCATTWLRAGMPIEVLSKMLGHANVSQTMDYVQLVRQDVEKQVAVNEKRFEAQVTA